MVFGHDMILPLKHRVDWELIRQPKQKQINREKTHENRHRFDCEYKVGDNIMVNNHTAYKYETPYKGPFVITQCFTNGTVMLQYRATENRYNIHLIKPYKLDT